MEQKIINKISETIKNVILSKSSVVKWEKTACKTLVRLYDIFSFQTFFCVFCDKEFLVHCFHAGLTESQKRKFVQKVIVQIQTLCWENRSR